MLCEQQLPQQTSRQTQPVAATSGAAQAPLQAYLFLNFALYAGLAWFLRRQVLRRVERD